MLHSSRRRWIVALSSCASIVLVGVAAGSYAGRVDVPPVDLGTLQPLEFATAPIRVRNYYFHRVRIVGGQSLCGAEGCNQVLDLPITVQPMMDAEFPVLFKAPARSGPFRKKFFVYTDVPGSPNATVVLTGSVADPADD